MEKRFKFLRLLLLLILIAAIPFGCKQLGFEDEDEGGSATTTTAESIYNTWYFFGGVYKWEINSDGTWNTYTPSEKAWLLIEYGRIESLGGDEYTITGEYDVSQEGGIYLPDPYPATIYVNADGYLAFGNSDITCDSNEPNLNGYKSGFQDNFNYNDFDTVHWQVDSGYRGNEVKIQNNTMVFSATNQDDVTARPKDNNVADHDFWLCSGTYQVVEVDFAIDSAIGASNTYFHQSSAFGYSKAVDVEMGIKTDYSTDNTNLSTTAKVYIEVHIESDDVNDHQTLSETKNIKGIGSWHTLKSVFDSETKTISFYYEGSLWAQFQHDGLNNGISSPRVYSRATNAPPGLTPSSVYNMDNFRFDYSDF
ncbi:MAG: hypothetical protein GY866_37940 [Proteobacteria bacterium]|nr:hypothetical protein [Pseudomonadota bacterium]